jgi:membrane protease YdiL (CAAX protease family)
MLAPALLLCALLVLLWRALQSRLRLVLNRKPILIFLGPLPLAIVFCTSATLYDCLTWRLMLLVVVYTMVPAACVYVQMRQRRARTPSWPDFAVILMLWLPLELSAGATLVPRKAQGVLHATAYGVAVTIGVILFLIARRWEGMRYEIPRSRRDLRNVFAGYAAAASLLIPFGLWIGFLSHPHLPQTSLRAAVFRIVLIFFGTAFPEEILFRALIQNWFSQRLRQQWKAIAMGGLIFGAAHLNNAPGPLPNWRYMAVATLAGFIFGTVFIRSTSMFASVTVHAGVNATKFLFF